MRIEPHKCVACGNCLAVCPVSVISIPKLKVFLQTALRHRPVTISQYRFGSTVRPTDDLNPSVHWRRPVQDLTPEQIIEEVTKDHTVSLCLQDLS